MLYFMDICCWRYSWLTLMLIIKTELSRGISESATCFTTAHLCPLGPRDRMNNSETECSNQAWVRLRASPRSVPESTYLSSGHNLFEVFLVFLVRHAACILWSDFTFGEAECAL
jgi:hypothetical protein